MKTSTIFWAHTECAYRIGSGHFPNDAECGKFMRKLQTFRAELLRRMDERDAMFYGRDGREYRTPKPPAPKPQIITRW